MILLDSLVVAKPLLKLQNVNVVMDSLATAKQVLNLQTEVKELSDAIVALKPSTFKETVTILVPVLAIISGFLIGWFVPTRVFNKQRNLEFEKRKADKEKERHEKLVSIYSHIAGMNFRFLHLISKINIALIEANFSAIKLSLETNQEAIKSIDSDHKRYMNEMTLIENEITDLVEKYTTLLSEYYCYFPETKVFKIYNEMSKDFIGDAEKEFNFEMNWEEIKELRLKQLEESSNYVHNTFSHNYKKISDTILKETGIKKI